jgi:hypothetical protein
MKRIVIFTLIIFLSANAFAQKKYTLSGYVKDAQSDETIIAANIVVAGKGTAVMSNQYGFYSLTLAEGKYNIVSSHVGYKAVITTIDLHSDTVINILLGTGTALSEEVVVTSSRRENNVKGARMGTINLPIEQIKSVPAFLGEVDLLKVVQLLPGVRNAGEGSAGIYVRGGGPDQNLIMLDDAVVYNTGHLFGFFSIFNADAIKNVSLDKRRHAGTIWRAAFIRVGCKHEGRQQPKIPGGRRLGLNCIPAVHPGADKERQIFVHCFCKKDLCGCARKTFCEKDEPVLRVRLLFL